MIKSLLFILIAFLLVAGGVGLYFYQSKPAASYPVYSSFAEIDQELYDTSEEQPFLPMLVSDITFDPTPYPIPKIKDEISRLIGLLSQRTDSLIVEHNQEYKDIMAIDIGNGQKLGDYIGSEKHPLTNEVYRLLSGDIEIIVANEKIYFNVPRPKQLDLRVNTEVETPATPSYPSLFAAKASLAGEILAHFMTPEDYSVIAKAIDEAIVRKQIVGVSTKFDTDYGSEIAKQYGGVVLNHEEGKEFLNLVREKEWSGGIPWQPINSGQALSNLKLSNPVVIQEGKKQIFKSNIENTGKARTPERFTVTLEFDRYNDGSVDKTISFAYGAILPGDSKELAYILDIDWPGTHSFRFVINKNLDFLEEYHFDNYGEWAEFTIEE